MNSQNNEFKTVIKSCEIFNACAAIDDLPTVHKESQQVPGVKIDSNIQALFSNTLLFSEVYHAQG